MIRVLIVGDSDIVRRTLSILLEREPGIAVVGVATDGIEAAERVGELLPDVVVIDVEMPKVDELEAARCIKQAIPNVGVLFLTSSPEYMEAATAAGGDGYVMKPFRVDELISQVRAIAAKYDQQRS